MKLRLTGNKARTRVQLTPLVKRNHRHWHPWMKWALIVMAAVVLLGLIGFGYYYPRAKQALAGARQIQAAAEKIAVDLGQQDFTAAKLDLEEIRGGLDTASKAVNRMRGLRYWPYVGRQFRAVESLLVVGENATDAAAALIEFADHLFSPFASQGRISLAAISAEEKGQILAGISQRENDLKMAQQAMTKADQALTQVPDHGLLPPLQKVVRPLKEQLPMITAGLDQAVPAARILPTVLGYPTAKKYLFLFENNTELRPGGGFIGTYGLITLVSGEIGSIVTDNSYNLDAAADQLPTIDPPDAIAKYLKVYNWYFRDSNWSPDFPTSAQQATYMYQREGGQRDLDGVIAITPTMVSALLELVGPITVNDLEFTADNFTDRLQKYVDADYKAAGINDAERKDIIGPLTAQLVDQILNLPLADLGQAILIIGQQLQEKQLLIYADDPAVQNVLTDQNWAGAIATDETSDYIMVVDANLASLKTDPSVVRTYHYDLAINGDQAEATLRISYRHTGKFDWKTTRYNTYTRIYVPLGSELIESSGAQLREKSQQAGEVAASTELGKTVWAAFKSIEPGATGELILRYKLPAALATALSADQYRLTWQKQPGLPAADLELTIDHQAWKNIASQGLDNQEKISHGKLTFSGSLCSDRTIVISRQD